MVNNCFVLPIPADGAEDIHFFTQAGDFSQAMRRNDLTSGRGAAL